MTSLEKTWYLIVNPEGGNGEVKNRWPEIASLLKEMAIPHVVHFTQARMHAVTLAQEGVAQGYRKVLAIGGDGTNNEVINGILRAQESPGSVTYALIPVGTGNDWVRTMEIPRAFRLCLEAICREDTRLMDVGKVVCTHGGERVERFFVNVAGMAYDAFVVRYMEQHQQKGASSWVYLWMLLKCLLKYRLQQAVVAAGGSQIAGRFYTINVGICKYSGGGMQFVPHADPYDGQLAVTLVGALSKPGVLLALPYLYNGRIGEHRKATLFQAETLTVDQGNEGEPVYLEVDGELVGHTPVSFSIEKQALRVVTSQQA